MTDKQGNEQKEKPAADSDGLTAKDRRDIARDLEKMMAELKESINQSLAEMIDPETYPSFSAITANDSFTQFTVELTTNEVGLAESMSVIAFYVLGGMYNAFNGTPVDDISVRFINAETGELIQEAHSSEAVN